MIITECNILFREKCVKCNHRKFFDMIIQENPMNIYHIKLLLQESTVEPYKSFP